MSNITQSKTHFLLFPTCIPVKGHHTSLLIDLDKGSYMEIPNLMYDILDKHVISKKSINDIKSAYNHKHDEGVEQYFEFFEQKMYGFFTNNPNPFKAPGKEFHSPHKVISSVVALDKSTHFDLVNVLGQLDELSCQLLQIRSYDDCDFNHLEAALTAINEGTTRKIEVFVPFSADLSEQTLMDFVKQFPRVVLVIYNAPENKKLRVEKKFVDNLIYTTQSLHRESKEVVSLNSFTITHQMYYEALNYNAGLFRKVCVDTNGDIKNYLSHDKVFGNVSIDKIKDIIVTEAFQEKSFLTNDKIEKCKDCQFRYMCLSNTDIKNENGKYQKVDTCGFDPYTNQWN